MFFVVSIIVSLAAALPIINYVSQLAKDAVLEFNLRQLSKLADIEFIEKGRYPESIENLMASRDVSKFNSGITYRYQVSEDLQEASILGAFSNRSYCWSSTTELIKEVNSAADCED